MLIQLTRIECDQCSAPIYRSPSSIVTICPECSGHVVRGVLVGRELKRLLEAKGYTPRGCQCSEHIRQMNRWGVAGCRENVETIVDWLEDAAKKSSVKGKALYIPGLRGIGRERIRELVMKAIEAAIEDLAG